MKRTKRELARQADDCSCAHLAHKCARARQGHRVDMCTTSLRIVRVHIKRAEQIKSTLCARANRAHSLKHSLKPAEHINPIGVFQRAHQARQWCARSTVAHRSHEVCAGTPRAPSARVHIKRTRSKGTLSAQGVRVNTSARGLHWGTSSSRFGSAHDNASNALCASSAHSARDSSAQWLHMHFQRATCTYTISAQSLLRHQVHQVCLHTKSTKRARARQAHKVVACTSNTKLCSYTSSAQSARAHQAHEVLLRVQRHLVHQLQKRVRASGAQCASVHIEHAKACAHQAPSSACECQPRPSSAEGDSPLIPLGNKP